MEIIVNDKKIEVPDNCTVDNLLEIMNIKSSSAVWINGNQMLKGDYSSLKLKEGDSLKVIRILSGG